MRVFFFHFKIKHSFWELIFYFKIKHLLLLFSFSFHFRSFFFPSTKHCYLPSQPHLIPPNLLLKTIHHKDATSANDISSWWMRLNHIAWLVFQNLLLFLLLLRFHKQSIRLGCVLIILMENITTLMGNWNFGPWTQLCRDYEIILLLHYFKLLFSHERVKHNNTQICKRERSW